MEMKKFVETIVEEIKKKVAPDSEVIVREVTKNNGVVLKGITILKAGSNIAPTVYLEDFYKASEDGLADIDELADQVIEISEKYMCEANFDVNALTNWEEAKEHIVCELVSADNNYLDDAVSQPFLDMAYVYKFVIQNDRFGSGSVKITRQIFNGWNITLEELHETAMKNTIEQRPAVIKSLSGIMLEMCKQDEEMAEMLKENPGPEMYVISNPNSIGGAITAFYPDVCKKFCEEHQIKEVCIIPSSIHECILFIKPEESDGSEINGMIDEVNQTQLEPEEVLSNHGYKYSLESDFFCEI